MLGRRKCLKLIAFCNISPVRVVFSVLIDELHRDSADRGTNRRDGATRRFLVSPITVISQDSSVTH